MSKKAHRELKALNHLDPYGEFTEEEIDNYRKLFDKFDANGDRVLDFMELKRMMEFLGEPQTHVQLKNMIKEMDEKFDGTINFTEFLLVFKRARDGELSVGDGLLALARLACIDVSKIGVSGAKDFFEAKAKALNYISFPTRTSSTNRKKN
ncbi:EF-hand domain-containing protein [Tropilaelaps mercedesae]|uniref:EF-hand domain-containing protein n=1 Tax=Tropilaelaps mercedesae TaxID=418985 RepID=A0A1V9XL20_9ACAR|nr:EF-hand domain-containing protein [Tropilaelaps mercedesae]